MSGQPGANRVRLAGRCAPSCLAAVSTSMAQLVERLFTRRRTGYGACRQLGLETATGGQPPGVDAEYVGRYRTEGIIGRGGSSLVLQAWDTLFSRRVALKVFALLRRQDRAPEGQETALDRFLREELITASLEHPGVMPVYDAGRDSGGRPFFVMRLVKGFTLPCVFRFAAAGTKGWTLERCLHAVVDVCRVVAYAHAKGIVHCDLKPENVMVTHDGQVFVLDWGLARIMGEFTHEPAILGPGVDGTPLYLPPERVCGEPPGYASDVYGLGCILYTLLAGRRPYHTAGKRLAVGSILRAIRDGPPVPVHQLKPAVPVELAAMCERAMARDKRQRFRRVVDLEAALDAHLRRPRRRGDAIREATVK